MVSSLSPLALHPRERGFGVKGTAAGGSLAHASPHPQPQLGLQSLLVVAEREQRDGQ